jgi:hypothetical protein
MGRTACTEPQCLYKGALYFLPFRCPHIFHKPSKPTWVPYILPRFTFKNSALCPYSTFTCFAQTSAKTSIISLYSRILDEICRNISRPRRVPPFAARGLSRRWTWRHLADKVGTSKGGEKQWQPTPKNLPRMHCARAIPVGWLGCDFC